MKMWRMPDDKLWALREAAKPGGFFPHATSTVHFLHRLEREGLLYQSDTAPTCWYITAAGAAMLDAAHTNGERV